MGRPFTLTRPRSHCALDAVMSSTMAPNHPMQRTASKRAFARFFAAAASGALGKRRIEPSHD
jgi:hypothetical protein